jgi:beta-glucosidase
VDGTPTVGLTSQDIGSRHLAFGDSQVQKDSRVVNKQVADEAIVLLKNKDAVLPLKGTEKVALVTSRKAWQEFFNLRWYGDSASVGDVVLQGTGSAQVRFNNSTTDYALNLVEALSDRGFNVVDWKIDFGALGNNNQAFLDAFNNNKPSQGGKKYVFSEEMAKAATAETAAYNAANGVALATARINAQAAAESAAAASDVGIFVLSRISGESADVTAALYNMEAKELLVYDAYEKAFHAAGKPLIVLLNVGGTTNTSAYRGATLTIGTGVNAVTATTDGADAILDIWNPGSSGTEAIADILKGAVNPSARLAQTFPVENADSPSVYMFAEKNRERQALGLTVYPGNGYNNVAYYADGVYVGYRFYESRPENYKTMVAYPFGYGLSYTNFTYSDLKLNKYHLTGENDTITATVKVTNTGKTAGKEVVQLFLSASSWQAEGRPKNDLRAYGKTNLLQPGDSETITLTIKYDDLVYFDDANPNGTLNPVPVFGSGKGWTVADGTVFTVTVRTNGSDAARPNQPIAGLSETFRYGTSSGKVSGATNLTAKSDGSVDAFISLVNDSDKEADALLIYGVYDAQGRLTKLVRQEATAASLTNESININISGLEAGSTVRAFVWGQADGDKDAYIPLCEAAFADTASVG